uniref:Uncharacterized protein n=1 Tax=Manihot esculenta TaxID=3983 RepID=A0A2C9U743_MANES
MASIEKSPLIFGGDQSIPPGEPMSMGQHMLDRGAQMLQSLKPIKKMSQHVYTFAIYSHDISRQIETHHYISKINRDFLQCAVYDTDDSNGLKLWWCDYVLYFISPPYVGVEYIVSDEIFKSLPPEEQKLWHSHANEVKSRLLVHPKVSEMLVKSELENLAKTYGKFWCTWQTDRGDRLPLGTPALMMSPQDAKLGMISPKLVEKRGVKFNILTDATKESRVEIAEPESINPQADYWKQHRKGFAIDIN